MKIRLVLVISFFFYLYGTPNFFLECLEDIYNDEYLLSILSFLESNPVDINKADYFQLQDLFWLSEEEIMEIISFRELNQRITEDNFHLLNIHDHDFLEKYITIKKPNTFSYHALTRFFIDRKQTYSNKFPYKYYQRQVLAYNQFNIGFISSKSADDKALLNHKSFYLNYNGDNYLRQLILGKYTLNLAQKICFGPVLGFSKTSAVINSPVSSGNNLRPYNSSMRMGSLKGVAAKINIEKYEILTFFSCESLDANLNDDKITSFYTGTHPHNIKKNNTEENILGVSVKYNIDKSYFGSYFANFHYDRTFANSNLYSRYNSFGIYYDINVERIRFFSEINFIKSQTSWIKGLVWGNKKIKHLLLYRNYSDNIPTFRGNPFSSSSNFSGEEGVYYATSLRLNSQLRLSFFVDLWKYSQPRYFEKLPTRRNEKMLEINYRTKDNYFNIRYNHRDYEIYRNINNFSSTYEMRRDRIIFNWRRNLLKNLSSKTTMEFISEYYPKVTKFDKGFLLAEKFRFRITNLDLITQIVFIKSDVLHYLYEYSAYNYFETSTHRGDNIYSYILLRYRVRDFYRLEIKFSGFMDQRKNDKYLFQFVYNI